MSASASKKLSILFATLLLSAGAVQADALPPVRSVGIDLNRYLGKWYEIAAFPMFFQRRCLGDTTAEYRLRPDGDIDVVNRCRAENGSEQAQGKAWVAAVAGNGENSAEKPGESRAPGDGQNGALINGQLKVSFFWPFRADYWVIGLDPDYRWALVGNPNRKYLWLLARTPQIAKDDLDQALQIARAQGYDLGSLRFTSHAQQPVNTQVLGKAVARP